MGQGDTTTMHAVRDGEVNKMTQCECSNWREVSGVVWDKEIPPPCMLYGMEK